MEIVGEAWDIPQQGQQQQQQPPQPSPMQYLTPQELAQFQGAMFHGDMLTAGALEQQALQRQRESAAAYELDTSTQFLPDQPPAKKTVLLAHKEEPKKAEEIKTSAAVDKVHKQAGLKESKTDKLKRLAEKKQLAKDKKEADKLNDKDPIVESGDDDKSRSSPPPDDDSSMSEGN